MGLKIVQPILKVTAWDLDSGQVQKVTGTAKWRGGGAARDLQNGFMMVGNSLERTGDGPVQVLGINSVRKR
jgi:hypothetical protein